VEVVVLHGVTAQ